MAIFEVQTSAPGVQPVFGLVDSNGDVYPNDSGPFLFMDLPSVRQLTVVSPHPGLPDFVQDYGPGSAMSPRFDSLRWNDPATGMVQFRFNNPDGVTVAVVRAGIVGFDPDEAISGSLL